LLVNYFAAEYTSLRATSIRGEINMRKTDAKSSITRRGVVQGAALGVAAASVLASTTKESQAQQSYEAIVIGSGFGGTIAALALHAQRKRTLLIERGTFWVTPETLGKPPAAAAPPLAKWATDRHMRVQYWSRPDHALGILDLLDNRYHKDNPYGLHHYQRFRQAHVLAASGVGGGSLIYSNVNLRAESDVLQRIGLNGLDYGRAEKFMETYRGKFSKVVTKFPLPPRAQPEQIGIQLNPDEYGLKDKDYLLLDRSRALRDAAAVVAPQLGNPPSWRPLNLSVTEMVFQPNVESDKTHTFCERQGRCMLGCLPQARHTLNKTLYNRIFSKDTTVNLAPESEVRSIKRVQNGYEVTYLDRTGDNFVGRSITVQAQQVFLAAGVLGTNEILLRSRDAGGLQLSDTLGHRFSTNGDFGALAVGTKHPDGSKMTVYPTRGPINTCDISLNIDGRHYTIEDCGIPSMFARIVRAGIDNRANLLALINPATFVANPDTGPLFGRRDPHQTEAEMIDDVFFFNAMGEDDASGKFTLRGGELDLDWDRPIADHPVFSKIEDILRRLSQAMNGKYTPLPTWEGLPFVFNEKTLIVTHPLGGCRIGGTMTDGVVNDMGQVYDWGKRASDSKATHPGLYIVDGSVIPGALAANPTLTIAAQALRAVEAAVGPLPDL
jgi:cholesterol oxidase